MMMTVAVNAQNYYAQMEAGDIYADHGISVDIFIIYNL